MPHGKDCNYDSDKCENYDSDCCDKYSKCDRDDSCSEKSYSSCSDSDYDRKRCDRRRRRKCDYYKAPPSCPKPYFGKKMAAKLCPCKQLQKVDSCAYGYANAVLDNKNRYIKWCVKVYDLSSDLYVPPGAETAVHFHKGTPFENGPIVKDLCLRKYKYYPRGYGDDYDACACKYVYVGRGKWGCDDKYQPLTPTNAELFACGLLYVNVHTESHNAGEVRGQLCDYDENTL